jgi:hypothetical protein
MLEAWKQAWRDAVENFRRELDPERYAAETTRQAAAMRRDLGRAHTRARHLQAEIDATRLELSREHDEENRCRHRESLALKIDDHETARIANEYASRHAERAAVLQQKLDALTAELALLQRDLQIMQERLATIAPAGHDEALSGADAFHAEPDDFHTNPAGLHSESDTEFDRLEQEARERAAEARLEELKRKLR